MTEDKIIERLELLAEKIRIDLRAKGFVVPCDNGDGTIGIDDYTIIKNDLGLYSITNRWKEVVIDNINLAQTAVVLANNLALGQLVDKNLIDEDRRYGANLFEEQATRQKAYRSLKTQNIDRAELLLIKSRNSKFKRLASKHIIQSSYDKLRRTR